MDTWTVFPIPHSQWQKVLRKHETLLFFFFSSASDWVELAKHSPFSTEIPKLEQGPTLQSR